MVPRYSLESIKEIALSVLALSSRFDGPSCQRHAAACPKLSVLALSSRFDGQYDIPGGSAVPRLSVLALSSRFDGRWVAFVELRAHVVFQYSLCRVVLMVHRFAHETPRWHFFQYSLCRVVLMVTEKESPP